VLQVVAREATLDDALITGDRLSLYRHHFFVSRDGANARMVRLVASVSAGCTDLNVFRYSDSLRLYRSPDHRMIRREVCCGLVSRGCFLAGND